MPAPDGGLLAPARPGAGGLVLGAPCRCERDESLLWREPLRRLSPIVIQRTQRMHDGHRHTELDLALVNDGAESAEQLSLSVLFFEEREGAHAGQWQTGERPLYFQGPLAPGQMARWHVEARGTSFDIVGPDQGTLRADGSDAAPAAAFAALASDGARAVRLHAARMLSFRGDEAARSAALALRPTASPAETAYLDRISAAVRDIATCRVAGSRAASDRWRIDACLFNRSGQARGDLAVRVLAFDGTFDERRPGPAPEVLAEYTAPLTDTLASGDGRTLAWFAPLSIEPGATPRAFELVVDREENLP